MNTHFMPAATMSAAKQEKGVSSERLNIRIYPQQKKLIELACRIEKLDKSKFIIQSSIEKAEKVINKNTTIVLEEDEYAAFKQALQHANDNITERQKECLKNLMSKRRSWE